MQSVRSELSSRQGNLLVAHVVLSLDVGGLERVVVDLVREGHERGIVSAIVCIERPGALATEARKLGVPVLSAGKRPGISFTTTKRLRSIFRELAPDIIHSHQIGALFYAGPAARKQGVRGIVHTEHGKHFTAGLRRRVLGRLAARNADRFFCVSRDIADSVRKYRIVPFEKIHVIRNGIRTALYQRRDARSGHLRDVLGIPSDALVIGTVGRLNEVKRQDILIQAFALLRRFVPTARLIIVGDGPARHALQQLVDKLAIGFCVHFVGYQSEPQRYFQLMDVFILTSRSEGMPLSVLEAWAAGVPVIATRVGGLPEMIEHGRTGLLIEFGSVEGTASALQHVLLDSDLRTNLGHNAQSHVIANFDVRNMVRDYHEQYTSLLREHAWRHTNLSEPN
ncbi:MAG TPA: glycosyltransferase [Tepidisphaeraceae bacterium]|nr:glycosyltransferase [Tepidisphaeraceae bacterium]